MNKQEFLDKLRVRLDVLEEKEIEDIIDEYSEHINEKIKSGTNEEEAIKEFGNIDELTKEILDAYKINDNYRKNKFEGYVSDFVNDIQTVFNKLISILAHGTVKQVFQMLLLIILALLLVFIIRIPFNLLIDFFEHTLNEMPKYIFNPLNTLCVVVINLLFIVVAFVAFIKLLKEKVTDNYKLEVELKKENKSKKKSNSKTKEEVIEESKIVYTNQKSFFDVIGEIIIICFKIFVAFFLFPAFMGLIGCAIILSIIVFFSIKYIFLYGPLLTTLGGLIGCIWFIILTIKFICSKKIQFGKSLAMLIVSLLFIGLGLGFTFVQLSGITYLDREMGETIFEKSYSLNEISKVQYFDAPINYVVDNTLENGVFNVKAKGVKYVDVLTQIDPDDKSLMVYCRIQTTKLFEDIANNLKDKKIYDYYNNDSLSVEIYGNEETISKIKGN